MGAISLCSHRGSGILVSFKSEMHLKCLPTAQRLEAETAALGSNTRTIPK